MADVALEIRGLTRRYGKRYAVQDLNLNVVVGDVYGFLGPNGAGKTTAMRAALGLIRRDAGQVRFFGESNEVAGRRHVGAIIETPCFHEWLSGRDNLLLSCAYLNLSGAVANAEIDRVLERVDLKERAKDRAGLLGRPRLLLLDEPTNGLDPRGMREIRDFIRSLALNDAITVFVSSHLLAEVQAICNRVGIIHTGTLRAEGAVDKLLVGEGTALVEIGSPDVEGLRRTLETISGVQIVGPGAAGRIRVSHAELPLAELNRNLVTAGIAIDALVPVQRNLEDVFLEFTT